MDIETLARAAGMDCALNQGSGSCVSSDGCHGVTQEHLERFAATAAASEREAHDYTKGKLAGALAALRQLQECVPPKDWKRYASEVLALDARDRERSNGGNHRPPAGGPVD